MITRLGGGSFADVYKAREKSTGEYVAIKILKRKYKKWEECTELRECKSLQILNKASINEKGLDNIIRLKRIIFIDKTGVLNLVFEYMEKDLLILMKSYEPKWLPENKIKDIIYQTLLGLAYMHKYGFFHRDLKPENLLLVGEKVKIADFGLAREIRSIPPYTEYVSTRYYRAPECILKSTNYNSPIDIWALGCVMAEMYLHPQPLFYGANEKEVLYRICSILGTPTYDTWAEGIHQAKFTGFKFPNCNKIEIENIITYASEDAIDLMKQMLQWDPNRRATASSLLNHKFFDKYKNYDSNLNNFNLEFNFNNCNVFTNNNLNNFNRNNNNTNETKNMKLLEDKIKESTNFGLGESVFLLANNNENKNEENNFSKMLNDTDGFNKLINQLKQEKIEEDKDYEKQKKDNNFNNLFQSIEQKLGLNAFDSNNKFNNSNKNIFNNNMIEEKEENEYNSNNPDNNIKKEKKFSFLDDYKFKEITENKNDDINNESNKYNINNLDDNKNEIDLGFNRNNLINKDNNDELGFENAERLKPIINNRRGSARKFLEQNENKIDKLSKINNNEKRLKYNNSNNLIGTFDYDKKDFTKPVIIKNDFNFVGNLNGIFNNKLKNPFEMNNFNFNGFKKRDSNYGKDIDITNNNNSRPYFLDNKNNEVFNDKKNIQKKPNFFENKNIWDL